MPRFITAASIDEIPNDSGLRCIVKGRAIALFRLGGEVHAIEDTCTHAEASLCDGEVSGDEIICPLHFATFNIRTGECTGPPADDDLIRYPVRIVGDDVQVDIDVDDED